MLDPMSEKWRDHFTFDYYDLSQDEAAWGFTMLHEDDEVEYRHAGFKPLGVARAVHRIDAQRKLTSQIWVSADVLQRALADAVASEGPAPLHVRRRTAQREARSAPRASGAVRKGLARRRGRFDDASLRRAIARRRAPHLAPAPRRNHHGVGRADDRLREPGLVLSRRRGEPSGTSPSARVAVRAPGPPRCPRASSSSRLVWAR
jgi:hypothetical protein